MITLTEVLYFIFWRMILPFLLFLIVFIVYGLWDYYWNVKPIYNRAKEFQHLEELNKNGFSAEKVSKLGDLDAIIIGSGMGGLSVGGLLARRNMKVLILEQHDIAGGCTHTFTTTASNSASHSKIGGYEFDTGLHYVGSDVGDMKSPFGFLFHELTQGCLSWNKLEHVFDVASISNVLAKQSPVPANETVETNITNIPFTTTSDENFETDMASYFPGTKPEVIRDVNHLYRWVELLMPIYSVLKIIPWSISSIISKYTNIIITPLFSTSTYDILVSCTKRLDLLGVLTYCYGDYVSIYMHTFILSLYVC